jgi:hypothetical protein
MKELLSKDKRMIQELNSAYSRGFYTEESEQAIMNAYQSAFPNQDNGKRIVSIKNDPVASDAIKVKYLFLRITINALDAIMKSAHESYTVCRDNPDIDQKLLASFFTMNSVYNTVESYYQYMLSRGLIDTLLYQVAYAYNRCFDKKIPISEYTTQTYMIGIPQIRNAELDSAVTTTQLAKAMNYPEIAKVFEDRADQIRAVGYEDDNMGAIYHFLMDIGRKKQADTFLKIDKLVPASDELRSSYGLPVSEEHAATLRRVKK